MQMVECDSCRRHFRASDEQCPFCDRRGPPVLLMNVVGGAIAAIVLSACYGLPPDKTPTGATAATGDTATTTTTPNDTSAQ